MIDGHKALYISVLNQGEISVELAMALDQLIAKSPFPLYVEYSAEKPISYNRNKIVERFLARPQYDYLLMIDSDIVPPANYLNLLDFQKDIISGLCFAFTKESIFPLVLKRGKKSKDRKYHAYESFHPDKWSGLMEVDAVGTGAIFISREVLEKVPYPFRNEYNKKTGEKELGLDLNFCLRAKKLGFKVFCHTDYQCGHYTRMDLKRLYGTMKTIMEETNVLRRQVNRLKKRKK